MDVISLVDEFAVTGRDFHSKYIDSHTESYENLNVLDNSLKVISAEMLSDKALAQELDKNENLELNHYDEAVLTELVEGICMQQQKSTFVKIVSKYLR